MDKYARRCEPTLIAKTDGVKTKNGFACWVVENELVDYEGSFNHEWYSGEFDLGLRPVIRVNIKL